MLTKQVGKGNKQSLKRVKVVNEANGFVNEFHDRKSIEEEIAKYNKKHFRKAYSSQAFKDKLYSKLQIEQIRDKILKGTLTRAECDNEDVYQFILLLRRPGGFESGSNKMRDILEEEWTKVVKKAK